jgi:hypothetical protein
LLGIFFLLKRPKLISKSYIEKSDQS